jgi:hypothetical protein
MKRHIVPVLAILPFCLAAAALPASAADVGVALQFSEPGVYGRVDIGRFPQAQVILSTPMIAEPPPVPPPRPVEPVYLWVPPEHQKHWKQHCREYHACGQPVYFVHEDWYRDHVMAERRHDEGHGYGREHHEDRGDHGEHGRGKDRDREDHDRDRGRD